MKPCARIKTFSLSKIKWGFCLFLKGDRDGEIDFKTLQAPGSLNDHPAMLSDKLDFPKLSNYMKQTIK